MNIESNKPKTIFKYKTKDGKEFYSLGLSKKKQDGSYENGFISCRFKKDTQLENKTKILIKEAWIDFYVKDRITYPYIFINKFEVQEEKKPEDTIETPKSTTTYDNDNSDVKLSDEDIDKVFNDNLELPF